MKKKILAGALLVSLISSVFAVETKYDSFGFHFSVPLIFENAKESSVKANTNMTSIGFGIHALSFYTNKILAYMQISI